MLQRTAVWILMVFGVHYFRGYFVTAGQLNLGIDHTLIDDAVQPCQDFYQFACGKWLETAKIPEDLPMWDRSFMAIREKNKEILRAILEKNSSQFKKIPVHSDSQKMSDFYGACMDEANVEKNSRAELNLEFKKIDALMANSLRKQLPVLLSQLHSKGVNAFFDFSEQQDFKDATQVIGVIDQAGLSLPDRDYYLNDDPRTLEVRKNFEKYSRTLFQWMGSSKKIAQQQAKKLMEIETRLAQSSMSKVDRRNPVNVYHRWDREGLKEKVPSFDWDQYWIESGVSKIQAINVTSPVFFMTLNELFSSEKGISLDDLKTYLQFHLLRASIPALPRKFVDEHFRFFSKNFSGQKKLEDRWKRCVQSVDVFMGFALGRSFVEVSYGEEGKSLTQGMIQQIELTFEKRVKALSWMDEPTKERALEKLHKIMNKVGYPQVWRRYDALEVDKKSYLKSLFAAAQFNTQYHLSKIGQPVDRNEWEMSPPTVNAYYNPSLNEMVFPAGILQEPFFNQKASMAVNYGGIGMVMGHELTHGFDDEGRKYNASGNLMEWWTPGVSQAFEKKAQCVVKEYGSFESLPGLFLNGQLTLGENIADLGGLGLAYQAWMDSRLKDASPKPLEKDQIPGSRRWSEEQQFFLAFAQSWCSKKQEPFARMLVKTDPHSPPKWRVNGSVSQFPKFAEAFQCQLGSSMAPVERCEVW